MLSKLYSLKDYASVALHYTAVGALAAGAVVLGSPWALAIGAGVTMAIAPAMTKAASSFLENELKEHPDTHSLSPNLRKTVDELSQESGLTQDRQKIFSFRPKVLANEVEFDLKGKTLKEKGKAILDIMFRMSFEAADKTPNAAASNFGQPVIIISEKLLELLNEDEQKAVLAHEFTHAAAEHQRVSAPKGLVSMATKISNQCMIFMGYIQTGFVGFVTGVAAGVVGAIWGRDMHPKGELVGKKPSEIDPNDLEEQREAKRLSKIFGETAMVGTLSCFNPAFLPVYAGAKSINLGLTFAEKSMSRSNEYQADAGAVKLGASPLALITSLRKLEALMERSKCNYFGVDKMPEKGRLTKMWNDLTATHPPTEKRVTQLAKIAHKQGYDAAEIDRAVNGDLKIDHVDDIDREVFKAAGLFYGRG
ncbi:MAG: M48 family metallopeptidase [Pseudomonadota bacterium]|nr:M48 family metallopeptidase [Pseudomonadota bacterium]